MAYHHNHVIGGIDVGIGAEYSGDERESRSGGEDSKLDSDVKPIYLLEHLATFTVNKDSGIVYPADGMRRLLQLEKTTGIWSQKMQLCLDYKWVLIMDFETGNIIERFPATLIQEPTAFTSTDAMELYNNILVFIVSGGSSSRSEMHIFQSQGVSAVHLVEDLKNVRSGKMVTHQREAVLQQQIVQVQFNANMATANSRDEQQQHLSHSQPYQHNLHLRSNNNANDPYSIRSGIVDLNLGGGGQNGETDSEHGGCINDETSSTSSDKYERDVTVLNHCFDDIEKFIARLQHAAAASRELERRRRNRKTKKKDPGEGLLTLRTRPPHEKEFIDIFAKFKLSFNLLAKLKAHIHDPNAPELVHFLFTPLALIVEASSDTYYDSQLPACVVNPILTREAINLLINCVTSKETELWRSLGEAWIIPRDQWKEDIGSYHPVFLDGWSPDYLVIDELELPKSPTTISKRRLDAHSQNQSGHSGTGAIIVSGLNGRHLTGPTSGYDDYDNSAIVLSEKYTMHQGSGGGGRGDGGQTINERIAAPDFSTRSEMSIDSIERSGGEGGLMGHNPGIIKAGGGATDNVVSASVMQSIITTGIQNLQTSGIRSSGGVSASGANDNGSGTLGTKSDFVVGGGGSSMSASTDDKLLEGWLENLQIAGAKIVLVTYPRTANNDKELSVVRGEYLEILDDTRKWWKARNIRGHIAHVPHTIVTPYSYGDKESNNQYYGHQHNNYKLRHSLTANAEDNIEPQQGVSDTTDWIRNKHIGKKGEFRYF